MSGSTGSLTAIAALRSCGGQPVRVRLNDGTEFVGVLRTDLLSERSISVFIAPERAEGTTLYIDDIVGVWLIS